MNIISIFKKNEKPVVDNTAKESTTTTKPTVDEAMCKSVMPEPEKTISEETKRVHNLIILDESGSMQSIYHPALTGVNETLQTIREAQKEHEDQTHFVSLIAFDTGHYNQIYCNTPAEKILDITQEQYRPSGCTPLYDAMGRSINELRPNVIKGDVVLVTVITDGYENASREYNGNAVKSLVEAMKQEGWVFTYIGANQDVEAVASAISIDNRLAFYADDVSTGAMFEHERRSRKKFFDKLSRDIPKFDLSTGYFDEDDEDDKDNKDKF